MAKRTVLCELKCLEKSSFLHVFLVDDGHCLQLQNARKLISASTEFQNFPGEHAPRPPLPGGPCQFFSRVSNSDALLFKTLIKETPVAVSYPWGRGW